MRAFSLRVAIVLLVVAALTSVTKAQRYSQDTRKYFDYGETFYSAVVQAPDGRSIDVRINTASAMFAFLRSERPRDVAQGAYHAVREITFEVTEAGNSQPLITRSITDTIFVPNYDLTVSKTLWHALNEHMVLPSIDPSKKYALRIEVRDKILGKLSVRPLVIDLKLREFRDLRELGAVDSTAIGVSDITLFDSVAGDRAFTRGWGSTYAFSRDITGSFSVILGESLIKQGSTPYAEVSLRQLSNVGFASDTGNRGAITIASEEFRPATAFVQYKVDSQFSFERTAAAIPGSYSVLFTIPGKQLEQGKYRLSVTVRVGGLSRTINSDINLMWIGMPVSLEDARDALAPMVHIMTESEFKEVQKGHAADMQKKLWAYWKKQDPTTETAFNERMAAFYQRVDYAYFNFATGRVLDGAMTDRGKIYILYGPPSKIERQLLPGESPFEVWTYAASNVRKTFRFVDRNERGEYKLAGIKDL